VPGSRVVVRKADGLATEFKEGIAHVAAALTVGVSVLFLAGSLSAGPEDSTPITASTAFDQLKGLSGTWEGKSEDGRPVRIEYKLAARGTTLIETQDPGTDQEMVSVYSRDGEELVMTHYCPMGPVGNQPHMRLDRSRSTRNELIFQFTSGTNLDAAHDMHVHEGRFVWLASNRIRREWEIQEGSAVTRNVFLLSRSLR
jgi:hypothetical protein